jgi:hypothetical protein
MKLSSLLKNLLLEYSQGQIDKTIRRWENSPGFDKNVALNLIKTFDEKKGGLSNKLDIVVLPDKLKQGNNYLNIDNYSYEDMEKLVPSIPENPEKIKKDAVKRFVDKYSVNKGTAQSYVARFLDKKDSLKLAAKEGLEDIGLSKEDVLDLIPKKLQQREIFLDPRNWEWLSFEQMMDALFPSQKTVSGEDINLASTEADKVYDKNGIEIYKGDDVNKCISYNPVIPSTKRKKYGWCVTTVGNTNYDYYRFMRPKSQEEEPTFYFVFDRNKPSSPEHATFDDQWHAFVIQVTADQKKYIVTGADNRGDIFTKEDKGWEGIADIVPAETWAKIKNLKDYFKPIPLSKEEKGRKFASGKNLNLDEFKELSQDEKILYIVGKASKNELSDKILEILPKYKISYEGKSTTLMNIAIDRGQDIPYNILSKYEPLAKRYAIVRFRYSQKPIPLPYVKYLDEPSKEEYLKTFDGNLTFDYIEKYFGTEQARKYANEQAKKLGYLPQDAIKYISDSKLKNLYSIYTKLFKNWLFSDSVNMSDEELGNQKEMPKTSINPSPLTYDDWKSLTSQEKQTIFKLTQTSDSNITKYDVASYAVPFFLQDNNKIYALLPTDDSTTDWVISDMNGKSLIKISMDDMSINDEKFISAYPDYSSKDAKRIIPLSALKIDDEPISLNEITYMLKLAGII